MVLVMAASSIVADLFQGASISAREHGTGWTGGPRARIELAAIPIPMPILDPALGLHGINIMMLAGHLLRERREKSWAYFGTG